MSSTNLFDYFRSICEQDRAAIVVCNLEHEIIYMNPQAAINYAKSGGMELCGKSLMNCHNSKSQEMITRVVAWFAESIDHNMIYTFKNEKQNKDVYMVALRDAEGTLIGYYEKHEYRNVETANLYDFDNPIK